MGIQPCLQAYLQTRKIFIGNSNWFSAIQAFPQHLFELQSLNCRRLYNCPLPVIPAMIVRETYIHGGIVCHPISY